MSIRVVIVDDHEMMRDALRMVLAADPDIAIIAEADDGLCAVETARILHPDVVVMDIAMPRLNGLEAARQIANAAPETKIIMVSAHANEQYAVRSREVGALGLVPKSMAARELLPMVQAVAFG